MKMIAGVLMTQQLLKEEVVSGSMRTTVPEDGWK